MTHLQPFKARKFASVTAAFSLALTLGACAKDPPADEDAKVGQACDPATQDGTSDDASATACAQGLSCEALANGEGSVCGAPLEIRGQVIHAFDDSAIEGAHVVAFDVTAAPASDVAITDADGRYTLTVPAARQPDGSVASDVIFTLAASADGFLAFPGGVRPSFPVDAGDPMGGEGGEGGAEGESGGEGGEGDPVFIENASTVIALIPLEGDGGVTVTGSVAGGEGAGTLVVAEGLTGELGTAPSTVADKSGEYTLFNVPAGSATFRGYRAGLAVEPSMVEVQGEDLTVDLAASTAGLSEVRGSVTIVNAGGGAMTSVVLVPTSTFDVNLERGAVPFGLRAPGDGAAPNIAGAFEIAEVPAGSYKVLAAFENDALVRDPDESIAGTDIVEIDVVAGEDLDVSDAFKVTEALEVLSPGADGPELVTSAPTLRWADDSSEDYYEVQIHNALGELVWERLDVPRVTGAGAVEVAYEGPTLQEGMYYQFRATSVKDAQGGATRISRTEDLKGIFVFGAP